MPVYEYLCSDCGPFTAMRPMGECDLANDCPDCGAVAPRVIMTAPRLSTLSTARRIASATNERSAHAPRTLSEMKAAHGSGCGCCAGKLSPSLKRAKDGSKSFPTKRPWMLSH